MIQYSGGGAMKRVVGLICLLCIVMLFAGCENTNQSDLSANDYLRIHIRANSNSMEDKKVKYEVKDSIITSLTPLICNCTSKEEMILMVENHFDEIIEVAENVLQENGFEYGARVKIDEEYFPTKTYGTYTLDADYYDAIIVELGEGVGNNWWCVVYPPLCFIQGEDISTTNFRYKSLILELIEKFFG